MNQRNLTLLKRVIASMFTLLFLMFLVVLFSGLLLTKKVEKKVQVTDQSGTVVSKRMDGERVWVSRFSQEQLSKRAELDEWVFITLSGCELEKERCLLKSKTERQGVDIIYSNQAPTTLPRNLPWYGGYINPTNGAFYDLFGRGYKVNSEQTKIQMEQYK